MRKDLQVLLLMKPRQDETSRPSSYIISHQISNKPSTGPASPLFHQLQVSQNSLQRLDYIEPPCQQKRPGVTIDSTDIYIPEANFTVMYNNEGRHRLIVAAHNRCTVISQERMYLVAFAVMRAPPPPYCLT